MREWQREGGAAWTRSEERDCFGFGGNSACLEATWAQQGGDKVPGKTCIGQYQKKSIESLNSYFQKDQQILENEEINDNVHNKNHEILSYLIHHYL